MGFVLSIDVGTTNIKAALVDENGHIVGGAKGIGMKIEGDTSGRAEHDPLKLRTALYEVCRQAINGRGQEVDCLSLTSYHFGLLLVDQAGGHVFERREHPAVTVLVPGFGEERTNLFAGGIEHRGVMQ